MRMVVYNRQAAVDYARKWAMGRNGAYMDFSNMGGDCTNFVSQCLVAGGMPQTSGGGIGGAGWFYRSAFNRAAAFSGVQPLYGFLVQKFSRRGVVGIDTDIKNLELGDVIQLSFDGVRFAHSLIIVGFQNGEPVIATHSMDCIDRALSTYTYARARGVHIVGGYM